MNGEQLLGLVIIALWFVAYGVTCSRWARRRSGEQPRDSRSRDDLA